MAYVVAAKWRAHPGKADRLLEVIEEITPPSRAEPGCLFYQAQRSQEDPDLFFFYEQYADEAGYQAHMDSEHFTRLVKQEAIPELLAAREPGTAAATIATVMRPVDEGTLVAVETDIQISGPAAQFGRGVMQEVSSKLMARFAECLAAEMGADAAHAADMGTNEATPPDVASGRSTT